MGPFELVPLAQHVRVIETNLLGVVHGSHVAVRQFLAQDGRGVLINMSSQGGMFPAPFAASYTASKFGIAGFTDSLRAELAARLGIAVCGVHPSFVNTPAMGYAGNYAGRALDGLVMRQSCLPSSCRCISSRAQCQPTRRASSPSSPFCPPASS